MRLAAALMSAPSVAFLASVFAALTVAFSRRRAEPPAQAPSVGYNLPQRVRVALQAAARARR